MKRELIIVASLLVIIFGINTICQNYLDNVINEMTEKFEDIDQITKKKIDNNVYGDNLLYSRISEMEDKWNKYKITLSLFLEHDELEKIDDCIVKIKSYIDFKDYEDTIAELNRCKFLLNHLKQKQSIQIINLF